MEKIMKPECAEYKEKIPGLFLGGLTDEERRTLEAHIAACPHCSSERESYSVTVDALSSAGEEEVPHHFFVYPEQKPTPWQAFCSMARGWQIATAGLAVLVLLLGLASLSSLQLRSDGDGWAVTFGGDLERLRNDILKTVEERERQRDAGIRLELARLNSDMTRRYRDELTAAIAGFDDHITRLMAEGDVAVRDEAQSLVLDLYRMTAQQRARDLETINLRLDNTETRNAIASRRTNEILGTLLEAADLGLR